MGLFAISCTTCSARLVVRDPAVIGQILECPKCGSMVQVIAPEGWQPPATSDTSQPATADSSVQRKTPPDARTAKNEAAAGSPAEASAKVAQSAAGPMHGAPPRQAEKTDRGKKANRAKIAPGNLAAMAEAGLDLGTAPQCDASSPVSGASTLPRGHVLWLAAGGIVMAVLAATIWMSIPARDIATSAITAQHDDAPDEEPPPSASALGPASAASSSLAANFDERWIPPGTQALLSLRLAALTANPRVSHLLARVEPLWGQGVAPLIQGLGLRAENVQRLTWAILSLDDWSRHGVVVVELENPLREADMQSLLAGARPAECKLGQRPCHCRTDGPWRQPFAVIHPRMLVSGATDLLEQLDPDEAPVSRLLTEGSPLSLLETLIHGRQIMLALDGAFVSQIKWPSGQAWPADAEALRESFQTMCSSAQTLACGIDLTDRLEAEIRVHCDARETAQKAHDALRSLKEGVSRLLVGRLDALTRQFGEDNGHGPELRQVELLLTQMLQALSASELGADASAAWARASARTDASQLAAGTSVAWQHLLAGSPAAAPKVALPKTSQPAAKDPPTKEPAPKIAESKSPVRPPSPDPGPAVDVQARLQIKLAAVEYRQTPLTDFANEMSQLAGVPITLDIDALGEAGLSPDLKVSVQQQNTTVGDALRAALGDRGVELAVERDHLVVTTTRGERAILRQVDYDVVDLAGRDPAALAAFAQFAATLVEPASWTQRGGKGSGEVAGQRLRVLQSGSVHAELSLFLEKLRLVRGLPTRGLPERGKSKVTLDSRFARARDNLETPVAVNFFQQTPLSKITAWLAQRSGMRVLIDGVALRQTGLSDQHKTTLQATKEPLIETLVKLTDSLEISFRIIDERTVQLTSREAAIAAADVEFYPLSGVLAAGAAADELLSQIQSRVAAGTWAAVGSPAAANAPPGPLGRLHFDKPSRCLIVLHTQAVQIQVETFLAAERAKRTAKTEAPTR